MSITMVKQRKDTISLSMLFDVSDRMRNGKRRGRLTDRFGSSNIRRERREKREDGERKNEKDETKWMKEVSRGRRRKRGRGDSNEEDPDKIEETAAALGDDDE